MKFYGREYELNVLNDIFSQCSNSYGKITVLTGRRRIGKTLLAKEYARGKDALYLFTSKKTEKLLCEEFLPLYEELTGERYIGVIEHFVEIFELFMKWGMKKPFVLIIDEFQSFLRLTQVFFQRFNIYGIPISLKRKYIYFSLVQSIQ